ncbi:MAG: lipocalin-like domain-containing protein [Usitatibacter sp.]
MRAGAMVRIAPFLAPFVFFAARAIATEQPFEAVTPGKRLEFPRDAGAHPAHRIEWWYVTGQLDTPRGPMGFQVTFFRLRNRDGESIPGRFNAAQLYFAHAALADPAKGRLLHDERSARGLEGLVEAATADTAVRIDDWALRREGPGYRTRVEGEGFALDLAMTPTQPVMLQGEQGFSQKAPGATHASYYYSEPHLAVKGRIRSASESLEVTGEAWLDHEWSSELLAEDAIGWDWLGANLDDGRALMAFRMRGRDGSTLWASATMRGPGAQPVVHGSNEVRFRPRRSWKSPRTGTFYPVAMDIEVAGGLWRTTPLMDDQELDARASTGTLYWEGAVRLEGPDGASGRGYLELTGYAERLNF